MELSHMYCSWKVIVMKYIGWLPEADQQQYEMDNIYKT